MRYMTLTEMLDELRAEARISQNVAHGVHLADAHSKRLRRVQEELYLAYDWPHLNTRADKAVGTNVRFAEYPALFTFEGITHAEVREDERWCRLTYGIEAEHYNTHDEGEQAYPIRRWQNYLSPDAETINSNMFEVWPTPDRDVTFRFHGRRKLFPLTEGAHKSSIDGPLIVLHAAAEILAAQKGEDASLKLQKAQDRQRLLKLRQKSHGSRPMNLAGRSNQSRLRPGLDYIPR